MRKIRLRGKYKNLSIIVDDEDYDWLSNLKWYLIKSPNHRYAVTNSGKNGQVSVHRLLMSMSRGDIRQVDHINHDGLDNRKSNLRVCTRSQNSMNRLSTKNHTSSFKGVSWNNNDRRWRSQISHKKKKIYLGNYKTEIEAAIKYDEMAKILFGKFAVLNF